MALAEPSLNEDRRAESGYPKQVPTSRAVREQIRARAWQMVAQWDRTGPLVRRQIESAARQLLAELGQPEAYLGWTMVMVGSAFWQPQVAAVPVERRLLLLPHCFRSVNQCQGIYRAEQLLCQDCGACRLCFLRAEAQRLGYQVLIAEGTPIVVDLILHGQVDAILGVACLSSLERSLEKILQVGLPCMAVPLWEGQCQDSQTDEDWVLDMLRTPYVPSTRQTETYLHLLRAARELFQPNRLVRWLPSTSLTLPVFPPSGAERSGSAEGPRRKTDSELFSRAPVKDSGLGGRKETIPLWETTERLAYTFLLQGGKHLRPFLTLAAYDAMTGGLAARTNGRHVLETWPEAIWQLALAIEVFHKASLIHDDIEDDDPYRYGRPAMHRQYGVPVALNVGDFLIGWGYRLAAEAARQLSAEAAADILSHLAHSHTRLCEGQGAELAWRTADPKGLSPLEVLKIYALKTAPAFEAALYVGLRMAGPVESFQELLVRYSRQLGVAFQISNDLNDWSAGNFNKRILGGDVVRARPTILWALARQLLPPEDACRLDGLLADALAEGLHSSSRLDSAPRVRPGGDGAAVGTSAEVPSELPVREAGRSGVAETLVGEVRSLYEKAEVFTQAQALMEKHLERAHSLAEQISLVPLKRLLHYMADMVGIR